MTLAQLAAAHGVATSYEDWSCTPVPVAPTAVVAALAALGVDADGDDAVALALEDVAQAPWRRLVPPTVVVRDGSGAVEVVVPDGADVALAVELEDGSRRDLPLAGPVVARTEGAVRRQVPLADLPLGWHALHATAGDRADTAAVVSAPSRLALPSERARELIKNEFNDVTDDEMKLVDSKYDDRAKALQAKAWSLAETAKA